LRNQLRLSPRQTAAALACVYAAAWVIPSFATPVHLFGPSNEMNSRYGWDALKIALGPLLEPISHPSVADLLAELISLLSAAGNLPILLTLIAAGAGRLRYSRLLEIPLWVGMAAGLLWLAECLGCLRPGYYLWLGSYPLAVATLRSMRRCVPAAGAAV
jgi:hypothetical protein